MSTPVMDLFDLTGRTALVTGGSRGLGLQAAEALGEAGAKLVLTARKEDELEAAAEGLARRGMNASWVAGDASRPEDVARICEAAIDRLGPVDILVNNAGATWGAPAETHPLEAWDKVLNLNLRAVFLFSQHIARRCMIPSRRGRIIMMGSVAGLRGNGRGGDTAAYNTSKAAVHNLTRALAGEWGEFGINVNALAPGFFPSKMTRATIELRGEDNMTAGVPLRRLGDEDDLKGAVLLFASRAGKHITGQVLPVDGGLSAILPA
ncbi:MAG TPA: SDR family oxidoreductase [Steroidobacteraceae bacterium]|jgi:gluconate 5-dehydrogenase|nr:SDR family oxidoreductase [Steroidobacteraceae bacterium]